MDVWDRRARGVARRGWSWGACAAVAFSLAACGSVGTAGTAAPAGTASPAAAGAPTGSASQARSAGGGTLCADAGAVDRLTVSRVSSLPGHHPRFSFPAAVTITDAAQARAVARALCVLQPEPRGTVACPADLGIIYRLDFTSGGSSLPPVTIRAGGCEGVSGTGVSRWTMRSPAFWAVLGAAMGLPHPGHAAFAGAMQS